ncbi:hypothetical protein ERJ75_001530100 [Trypanosoma vivax]|uniref:J domain-containing protein n=1 Tax=Trypanosoma vivax (strain Y486) TaxID=1055687 RepID=G0UB24_TRYVY|nr:hypothetical protein ERJ75_001530100 [Trypanosoma vivax]CCC53011.1 conserved hypothetical protein [Trypanosoma vivax Y486]
MLRLRSFFLCTTAIQRTTDAMEVVKDYRRIEAEQRELAESEERRREYETYPLRYRLLDCKPGMPLALAKLKYLLACRRTHPDAGGDAEAFLRVSLAYQDVMKDYGVETVENKIANLGNFQVDSHEAQNYLEARTRITSYIPMSTLEDHIRSLEEVRARIGDDLADRIAANDDEAMLLLEDIEEMMEENGLRTVRLEVLEDGSPKLLDKPALTDGTERPLYLGQAEADEKVKRSLAEGQVNVSDAAVATSDGCRYAEVSRFGGSIERDPNDCQDSLRIVELAADDIAALIAKNTVQERTDVAGLASRTATEVMKNTKEMREIRLASGVLYVVVLSIFLLLYVYVEGLMKVKKQEKKHPQTVDHVTTDTMLPWWGNDSEYESQVKRIFVGEWRRARASSQRVQTFQDGVGRESLDEETKREMDLKIFTVTAERLREMRERAEKHPGLR